MKRQYIYFNEIPKGATFAMNGNQWRKRSARTAEIVRPTEYAGTWFYFRARDLCVTGEHSRIAEGVA